LKTPSDRPSDEDVPEYRPMSLDSMFTRLSAQLKGQDAALERIEGKVDKHADKLWKLERDKWLNRGMAGSGVLAACHHIWTLISK
jgi:hypothetical protein